MYNMKIAVRAETWVLTLGGHGARIPNKLGGALVSTDEKYTITVLLIIIKLYF